MRLMLEVAVVAALIAFGWNKSFGERFGMSAPQPPNTQQSSSAKASGALPSSNVAGPAAAGPKRAGVAPAAATAPSATPDTSWMWDPNRKGSLDGKRSPQPKRP